MEDKRIIALFWSRDEMAIEAAEKAYGGLCRRVADNILPNVQDAEECVNDTWLHSWNSMPPQRPKFLAAFLCRITRNLAFNRYKQLHAGKRGGGEAALVLEELAECVSGREDVESVLERELLVAAVNEFLAGLPERKRDIFLRRYWYADSVADIAACYRMTPGSVSAALSRMREKLRRHLTERGFDL